MQETIRSHPENTRYQNYATLLTALINQPNRNQNQVDMVMHVVTRSPEQHNPDFARLVLNLINYPNPPFEAIMMSMMANDPEQLDQLMAALVPPRERPELTPES